MGDSLSKIGSTSAKPNVFQFGLADILMAMSIIALAMGVARAWEIGGGICVGLLATAILAVSRRRTVVRFSFLFLLVGLFSISTWMAWNMHVAQSGSLGTLQDRSFFYQCSDKRYFNAYSLVLYTGDCGRIYTRDRMLILPDRSITFPNDVNVAIVNNVGEVRFVTIPDHCFIREPHASGFYMLGIPFPSFRTDPDRKRELDRNRAEKTHVWKDEIVPFLLHSANCEQTID